MARDLIALAARLDLALTQADAARQLSLLDELERWNRAYNLTAITDRPQMITHHLLDSLSIHRFVAGERIADVGCGAGFPGLPLAIALPRRQFTLIDSNSKKIRFVSHAVRTLGLNNVEALHARVEELQPQRAFDCVVARAFAPLPAMLAQLQALCDRSTRVLAMKGQRPEAELAALPPHWNVDAVEPLEVPNLDEQRHLVILRRSL